jgi:hypothetical protein
MGKDDGSEGSKERRKFERASNWASSNPQTRKVVRFLPEWK